MPGHCAQQQAQVVGKQHDQLPGGEGGGHEFGALGLSSVARLHELAQCGAGNLRDKPGR